MTRSALQLELVAGQRPREQALGGTSRAHAQAGRGKGRKPSRRALAARQRGRCWMATGLPGRAEEPGLDRGSSAEHPTAFRQEAANILPSLCDQTLAAAGGCRARGREGWRGVGGSGTTVFSWLTSDGDSRRTGRSQVEQPESVTETLGGLGGAPGRTSPALHLGGRPPDSALQRRADAAGTAG